MHKAIYLEIVLELAGESSGIDDGAILQDALRVASPGWSNESHLSVEVKRIRPEKSPLNAGQATAERRRRFSLLLYLEGEQDAPQNFLKLTTEQLQKLLEKMAVQLHAQRIEMKVERIQENTSAVDELADQP